MKSYIISILCICFPILCNAQINITPFLSDDVIEKYPDASNIFISKLNNILSANDIRSEMGASRFVLTGKWIVETKDVVSSAPPQIAYVLNIHLSIGDGEAGIKYISETFRVKGVGATEEKAYIAAIKSLRTNNDKLNKFVTEGKQRIIDYYENNKNEIMSSIDALILKKDYDEAIYKICLIPMECSYYLELQDKISEVYQRIIDNQAEPLFTQAKLLWASSQTEDGAKSAIDLVSQIDPNATCYPEVQGFIDEVNAKISLLHERAYQTYKKNLAHRQEMGKLE